MTNDSAFISEIWSCIKENVDESQYLEICDKLVELFDMYHTADGFTTDVGFDQPLALSIATFYGLEEGEEYDN